MFRSDENPVSRTVALAIAILATIGALVFMTTGHHWLGLWVAFAAAVNYWLAWDGVNTIMQWVSRHDHPDEGD